MRKLLAALALVGAGIVGPQAVSGAGASTPTAAQRVLQTFNAAQKQAGIVAKALATVASTGTPTFATELAAEVKVAPFVTALLSEQTALLNMAFTGQKRLDNTVLAGVITRMVYDCGAVGFVMQSPALFGPWIKGFTSIEHQYEAQAKTVASDLGFTL